MTLLNSNPGYSGTSSVWKSVCTIGRRLSGLINEAVAAFLAHCEYQAAAKETSPNSFCMTNAFGLNPRQPQASATSQGFASPKSTGVTIPRQCFRSAEARNAL